MTINRTTLLDLPLPVTGTESGTWGDVTNNGLSQYVDIAVAGMNALTSSDFTAGALTISNTQGDSGGTNIAAGSAQYATIKVSSLATNSTITAPASNRSYRIVNLDSTYNLTIKASGQTGITFLPGQTGVVAFTGTDYEVVGVVNAASSTDNAVPKFDGTTGQIIQNTGVTIDDSNNVSGVAQLNATTADLTNIEVTNIKAKDGTSAGSIADSTGVVTLASSVLTTTDINGGTIDGAVIGGASAAAGSFTTLNTSGQVVFNDAGADVDFRVEGDTDANLLFVDASTDRVGVGTSSPARALTVFSSSSGNNVRLYNVGFTSLEIMSDRVTPTQNIGGISFLDSTTAAASQIVGQVDGVLAFVNGGAERMRIDSSGNVMIGNTVGASFDAISKTLSVGSGSGTQGITVYSGTASAGSVVFADGTSGTDAYQGIIQYEHTNNELLFYVNYAGSSAPRMRIDSSGNVGIGTTPSKKLQVAGDILMTGTDGIGLIPGINAGSLFINRGGSFTSNVEFGGTTSNVDIGAGGGFQISLGKNECTFSGFPDTANVGQAITLAERMRIDSSGYLRLAGGGIQFNGDTAAANALDDYEEGTWTAVITTTGGSVTIGSQTCTYTKVGRLVTLNGIISVSGISSPTGQLTITGLPFTPAVADQGGSNVYMAGVAATSATSFYSEVGTAPRIYIAKYTELDTISDAADLLTASSLFKFGAFYSV
ncbi:beta strand repeat-containing protein [Rheinheimera sp.]|uniref:beta strand repeat-containing protein n=1 Tax=Rheinheimera sp. TaxID=1869214 RepID=UPI004047D0F6